MKGVVFTEFVEMVEDAFSPEVADSIIMKSDLQSGGVYTSLGTYSHHEMLQMVTHLSEETGMPVPDLVRTFGEYLFGRFVTTFPQFFDDTDTTFTFLRSIERYIHVEVRKLYPDAELPSFIYEMPSENQLEVTYQSKRPFADLAHGLINAAIQHFEETIDLSRQDIASDGTHTKFTLVKTDV